MSPQEQYLAQNSLAILRDKNVRAGEDGARLENGKYLRQACFLYRLLSTERNERYFPCSSLRFVRQT